MNIAHKNDVLRQTMIGCRIVFTPGVADSPDLESILTAVREFKDFTADNDPHGEHDFGAFTINNTKYFFKFDYYDDNFEFFEEDGKRVLTIMRADEY